MERQSGKESQREADTERESLQVIHHLFPSIDPSHYTDLAPIVAAVCADHAVPYTAFSSWPEAWAHHVGWVARLNADDPAAAAGPAAAAAAGSGPGPAEFESSKSPRAVAAAAAAAAALLDAGPEEMKAAAA